MFDSLWVEKYRPKSLQDILLTEELGEYFNTLNEDSEISNLLFVGTPVRANAWPAGAQTRRVRGFRPSASC